MDSIRVMAPPRPLPPGGVEAERAVATMLWNADHVAKVRGELEKSWLVCRRREVTYSSAARTVLSRRVVVAGFSMKRMPLSSTPWWTMVLPV